VSGTDPEASEPYAVFLSGQARCDIRESLPLEVALAAMATIDGSIAVNPYRAGKPLDEPFDGYHSARRGTYRIIYRIDEAKHQVLPRSGRRAGRVTDPDLRRRGSLVRLARSLGTSGGRGGRAATSGRRRTRWFRTR
jgi:mRNA interferase RelE/StbE